MARLLRAAISQASRQAKMPRIVALCVRYETYESNIPMLEFLQEMNHFCARAAHKDPHGTATLDAYEFPAFAAAQP
ncbi:MAG: hypothetical protein ACXWVD_16625, partial [Telluria sp.]